MKYKTARLVGFNQSFIKKFSFKRRQSYKLVGSMRIAAWEIADLHGRTWINRAQAEKEPLL